MPRDFSGATLHGMLHAGAAQHTASVSDVLPQLHAVASTRVCVNIHQPTPNQFFWHGQSNGVWFSHKLFRAHAIGARNNGTSSKRSAGAGVEPCTLLRQRAAVPLPEKLTTPAQLNAAADALNIPVPMRKTFTPEQLLKRLRQRTTVAESAHMLLRRRLAPLRDSELRLGDRANLDVNRNDCPPLREVAGCDGAAFARPFLGAFRPGGDEWVDRISAAPPFKYCRQLMAGTAELPIRRVPGIAVLMPELHANLNVGHAAKDLVFLDVGLHS